MKRFMTTVAAMAVAVLVTLACTATVMAGTPNPQNGSAQAIDPAFLQALAGMEAQDPYIGDSPQEGYPVAPDPEVTVVDSGYEESPCIDGFKTITDWTRYSDGTEASSIVSVPCVCTGETVSTWKEDCNTCWIDDCGIIHCTKMLCGGDDGQFDDPDDGGDVPGDDVPGDDGDIPGDNHPGDQPGGETQEQNPVPQTQATTPITASSLPYTGGKVGTLALVAGSLALLSLALIVASRRRQRS